MSAPVSRRPSEFTLVGLRRAPGRHRAPGAARLAVARHAATLSNTGSLVGTTLVTSLVGFGFWWVAARLFPPSVVGYGSAAVSAATLLGTVGMLGLGTVLIGELARRSEDSGGLVSASLLVSGAAGAVLAVGFVLLGPYVTGRPIPFVGSAEAVALFVLAVALTGLTAVLDEAFVGVLLSSLDLQRNLVFSVSKLLALYLLAFVVHDRFGVGILAAWVVGLITSLLLIAVLIRLRGIRVLHLPQWSLLRRLSRVAGSHNWLNLVLQAPQAAIPLIATGLVSATAGASFYAVWMVMSLAFMVPTHLSTVLYAVGAADAAALRREIRFTLRLSLMGGLVGVPLLVACASIGLHLFGPTYAEQGAIPLRLLAFAYFPIVFRAHYVALSRIHRRTTRAAALMTVCASLELGAAVAGAVTNGLLGLSIGLFFGMCLEGALTGRTVLRAAFGHNMPGSSKVQQSGVV